MPKIKCLLVDDHTLFRQGVRRLLESESDFEVIGEAADGGEAVEKARELRPDIVLMDIGMPGLSSFESARQIKKNRIETKILFLTMYEDEDYLVQCLEVGASGYVLKDTPAPQLLTAVKDVYKGLSVKTVEAHKFNLMRKLDIHNKAQLVTYAIQKKIIKIPVNQ
jgi:DNA-binding NarL/FixJ family response regulator